MHNKLRIIAGKWRSRRINFLPLKGVRPTTDANRETLFNWIGPSIIDATCLDLFAGSGALGFEALSRGAQYVVMLDSSPKIIRQLQESANILEAKNLDIILGTLPKDGKKIPNLNFNIVFLDPPFGKNIVSPCIELIEKNIILAKNALIYIKQKKS